MTSTAVRWALAASVLVAQSAGAITVTRGPYLQQSTPTGIIVRWRTDLPSNSRVAYGPSPGSLSQNADDILPTTEHVVSLTGLGANTQYYYSVGSVSGALVGDDLDHYFRSAPPTGSTQPIRIWSIGDAGWYTGANAPNAPAVRNAYKAFNGGTSTADLFLLLGDNAYTFGTDADFQVAVFDTHAEMLRTTPVWSTFGNHERFSSFDMTQTGPYFDMFSFPTGGEAGGVASGTEAYYSFDFGNVHFINLDSEDFTPTSASGPMLTWLQSDLAGTTADWVIALWHRPPYSRGLLHNSDVETNEINMRQYVVPVLESVGVDVVLNGHSHNYERSYFLDGHYGMAATFSSANQVDSGDGDPAGDGAYRKDAVGPIANSGAVYVVNGSGSEVRNTTLNHPAHVVGLLELGSLVLDITDNVLTARFLTSTGLVHDEFSIVKASACGTAPVSGCLTAAKGKLLLKTNADPSKNRWKWKWQDGVVNPAVVGDPLDQTDLAVCVYDQTGALVGGSIPSGAAEWSAKPTGLKYLDKLLTRHGIQKIKVKYGTGSSAQIQAKAKGAGIVTPTTPLSFPVTAQLVNLDSGACWESVFPTFRKNDPGKVVTKIP